MLIHLKTRNKALIITGLIIFGLGLILFLIGGIISGWDMIAFIHSQTFIWICVLIGLYVVFSAFLIVKDILYRL